VADVGSGTGTLSELFLRNGNSVFGVEPNRAMREAGEALLKSYSQFTSIAGRAEATTLADHSVDFVVAGQAFHCLIVRKHGGNLRGSSSRRLGGAVVELQARERDPFLEAYEQLLLTYGTDYDAVAHKQTDRGESNRSLAQAASGVRLSKISSVSTLKD